VAYRIVFTPRSLEDLKSNFTYVADAAGIDVALAQDARIRAACRSLADFPRRGRGRDEIRPGLRSIPCARAFIVFYAIDENEVRIIRVLHARREIATAFEDE